MRIGFTTIVMAWLTLQSALAARTDLGRYAVILERMPFGEPPPAVAAPPPAPVAQPRAPAADSFIKALRMCAITENDAGTRVGLVDIKSKPQKTYFLYVGEQEDGLLLVEADYATERAKLRKDGEEYWISMKNEHQGAAAPVAAVAAVAAVGADNVPRQRLSYAERLRRRREAEAARIEKLAERPKLTTEELEEKLREFQMDVIRKGEPALPIPLTPEMDAQLVSEGVLPPLEE